MRSLGLLIGWDSVGGLCNFDKTLLELVQPRNKIRISFSFENGLNYHLSVTMGANDGCVGGQIDRNLTNLFQLAHHIN